MTVLPNLHFLGHLLLNPCLDQKYWSVTTDISKEDSVGVIFFTQGDRYSDTISKIGGGSVIGFYTAIVLILGNTIRSALFVNQAYIYLNMP